MNFLNSVWNLKGACYGKYGFDTFALGYRSERLTVLTQQMRALKLAQYMGEARLKRRRKAFRATEGHRLSTIDRICVVGAGICGLTFASAVATLGIKVDLLEQHSAILPLQRGNLTRYLHPNIYEWPLEGAEVGTAGLPLLDWRAGPTGEVVAMLKEQWDELLNIDALPLEFHPGVERVWFAHKQVFFSNLHGIRSRDIDAVVLAVGFGLEQHVEKSPVVSYWKDDALHQMGTHLGRSGLERRILVAGTGDGGLIDSLRLCLSDFRHDQMIEAFGLTDISSPNLLRELRRIATERQGQHKRPDDWQFRSYEDMLKNSSATIVKELKRELDNIDERIKQRGRNDTKVTLLGRGGYPFDSKSALLNSFLVWRLSRLGIIRYVPGELHAWSGEDGNWTVAIDRVPRLQSPAPPTMLSLNVASFEEHLDHSAPAAGAATTMPPFDHLVVRTGRDKNPFESVSDELLRTTSNNARWEPEPFDQIDKSFGDDPFPRINRSIADGERARKWLHTLGFREGSSTLEQPEVVKILRGKGKRKVQTLKTYQCLSRSTDWNSGVVECILRKGSEQQLLFLIGPIGTGKSLLGLRYVADNDVADNDRALFLNYGAKVRSGPGAYKEYSKEARVIDHLDEFMHRRNLKADQKRLVIYVDGLDFYACYRANLAGANHLYTIFNTQLARLQKLLNERIGQSPFALIVTLDLYDLHEPGALHQRLWLNAFQHAREAGTLLPRKLYLWPKNDTDTNGIQLENVPAAKRVLCRDSTRMWSAEPPAHQSKAEPSIGPPLYDALASYNVSVSPSTS